MRSVFRFCGAALCCVLLAAGAAQLITRTTRSAGAARLPSAAVDHDRRAREKIFGPSYPNPALETFVDPNAPAGSTDRVFLDPTKFDGTVFSVTVSLAGENREPGSLKEYREVIGTRAQRARAHLEQRRASLQLGTPPTPPQVFEAIRLYYEFAFVALYEGDHDAAATWLGKALGLSRTPGMPPAIEATMTALLGVNSLRRGEQDNCIGCVGPSSCIFPIGQEARHTQPAGSREAVALVHRVPRSIAGRPASSLVAEHRRDDPGRAPGNVPPRYLIPVAGFRSKVDVGRFENVAGRTGLIARGPDLAGGASSTTSTATAGPTSSPVRSTSPMAPRSTSTVATAHSRIARRRPAWASRSTP